MSYLGVRIPDALDSALTKMAQEMHVNKSKIVREALENHVFHFYTKEKDIDWKIMVWSLFGIDSFKINYALARAGTPDEFFSYLSKWIKNCKFKSMSDKTHIIINLSTEEYTITSKTSKDQPKENAIRSIIEQWENKITQHVSENI